MISAPGTLEWMEAASHPELLAPPVAETVRRLGIEGYVAPIDPTLADTAAFCAAYGVTAEQSANCVVIESRRAEQTRLAACHVLASDNADVNKAIRKHLGGRKASFASMETATALTGMEYGGIVAIGVPGEWPILIDEAVAAADWVVVGSGLRGSKLALHGAALADLPGAEVLAIAQA